MENSLFSRLPPELRDLIYNFLFTTSYAVTLKTNQIQHPLTQICRQIRHETLALCLSLTRFNAHLDDGPATPLALWLQAIGPEQCLLLREVGIWDMHMLNGSLHGVKATERILQSGTGITPDDDDNDDSDQRRAYVLKPVGRDIFHGTWYLHDLIIPLQAIGLGLQRFCEVLSDGTLKQTSHFAIQLFDSIGGDDDCGLAGQFGLNGRERDDLIRQLDEGKQLIQLHEGRRTIFLAFDEERRLVAMRQMYRSLGRGVQYLGY